MPRTRCAGASILVFEEAVGEARRNCIFATMEACRTGEAASLQLSRELKGCVRSTTPVKLVGWATSGRCCANSSNARARAYPITTVLILIASLQTPDSPRPPEID